MKRIFIIISVLITFLIGLIFIFPTIIIFITELDTEDDEYMFDTDEYGLGELSTHVLAYESTVAKYAKQMGIEKYTPVILAIMQQESGGNPDASDPMQSSESLCGQIGCITNADHSIKQGVTHFKGVLDKAEGDLKLAIHSYNFGTGFIDYVKKRDKEYKFNKKLGNDKESFDLAIKFSQEQYQKQVSAGNGSQFTCLRAEAKPLKACYGDILYVWSVLQYVAVSDGGEGGKGGEKMFDVPSGTFATPVKGEFRMTSPFGSRTHPITGDVRMHNGIDLGVQRGTKVASSAKGTVTKTQSGCTEGNMGCGGGWGNYVIVKHNVKGKSYETVYAHLTKPLVSTGQKVSGGELIGLSGNTGGSKGPHLHFELHDGAVKNPIDPAKVIK